MKDLFSAGWKFLSLKIPFEGYRFSLWEILVFPLILAFLFKVFFIFIDSGRSKK